MAGNAVIGSLSVILGVDTATFETGLKSAATRLGVFAGVGIAAGEALGRALGGAVRDLALAIPKTIDQFDNLSKTSQKIGVSVEQLGALQHAAELSRVSAESLTKGLGKLARSVVDAAQGSTTAVAAYQTLGIAFRDATGHVKLVGELLPEIADKFAKMKDGTAKTALAMQIFGKTGANLIPMLNGGSAGLKEMSDEARALGLIISGETAITAENFNDNLTRLRDVLKGVVTQLTANILPALAQFSQFLIDGAKNSGFLQVATDALTAAFNGFARAAIIVYDNIRPLAQLIGLWVGSGVLISLGSAAISVGLAFVKLSVATRTLGLTMAAFEAIRSISTRGLLFIAGVVALAAGAFDNFGEKIKALGGWLSSVLPEGTGEKAAEILKTMGLNLDGLTADLNSWKAVAGKNGGGLFDPNIIKTTKDALDSFIASKEKAIAGLRAEIPLLGQSNVAMQAAKTYAEGLAIAQQNHIPITEALKQKLSAMAQTFAQVSDVVSFGRSVFEQTRTPVEQYQQTIERLNVAYQSGAISADTYARAVVQAQEKMLPALGSLTQSSGDLLVQLDKVGASFASSFGDAFTDIVTHTKSAKDAFKDMAANIIRSLANMVAQMLIVYPIALALRSVLGGFFGGAAPLSLGSAGGMAGFKGFYGFANGGSFEVGGSGGIDSQMVAFKATPGEMVNVSKGDGGPVGGVSIDARVNINGNVDKDIWPKLQTELDQRDRKLAARIIPAVRDARSRRAL